MSEVVGKSTRRRKAISKEAREVQLSELAMDLVEQRLREGTATSQEIVYALRLGSTRETTEREKMQKEIDMLVAKVEAIKAAETAETLYANAIRAIGIYQGKGDDTNLQ